MKRWIHASTNNEYIFTPGEKVTYYNSAVGHANYDSTFVRYETDKRGYQWAVIDPCYDTFSNGPGRVSPKDIIPSEKDYLYSLKREDVLTKEFIGKLVHRDDSIWCRKIYVPRVDRNPGMENVTGIEADIMSAKEGEQVYRVVITTYITKNYQETREHDDEHNISLDDALIQEALDILKDAPEVVVNYAGYQRKFEK